MQNARQLWANFAGAPPVPVNKKSIRSMVTPSYIYKVSAQFDNFRKALDLALYPLRPDRKSLYGFYREVELDDEVITQTRVACVTVKRAPFEVLFGKKLDEKATELFTRPWFYELLEVMVKTEFWGHSLVEFTPEKNEKGEFASFSVITRDHVRPEYGDVLRQFTDTEGIKFRDPKAFPLLLEFGRADDIGLYHVVAIPALRKRYADTDWSLFSERFGSPFLVVRTQATAKQELDNKEKMAANFTSNGYAILDDQDQIDMLERKGQNGHLTYADRIALADKQIAKIINGQASTSDEKAHVGSAEVHERILNDFTFDRMVRIQNWINFGLIPFLVRNGYALDGATFEFVELRKQELKELSEPVEKPKPGNDPAQKKSPKLNAPVGNSSERLAAFNSFYRELAAHDCSQHP